MEGAIDTSNNSLFQEVHKLNVKFDRLIILVEQILVALSPPIATGFKISIEKENQSMLKAGVDLQILENGTVKYTATPVDAKGQPTTLPVGTPPLTWVASDPDLTLASDPADTSGFNLSQIGTAGNVAVTGIVVTCSTTLPGATAPITAAAAAIDIVPAPPGAAVGFVVTESAG